MAVQCQILQDCLLELCLTQNSSHFIHFIYCNCANEACKEAFCTRLSKVHNTLRLKTPGLHT